MLVEVPRVRGMGEKMVDKPFRVRLFIEIDVDQREFLGRSVVHICEMVKADALKQINDIGYTGRVKGVYIPNLDGTDLPL